MYVKYTWETNIPHTFFSLISSPWQNSIILNLTNNVQYTGKTCKYIKYMLEAIQKQKW